MTLPEQYQKDGFCTISDPVFPTDVVDAAIEGMDAVRAGKYDTGHPPENSRWNPGDDPKALCKIEMPQFASHAIMDLVSHPALGKLAAEVTGAKMVQVWWVQLLYKPVGEPTDQRVTNIGWHQDRQYWKSWAEESELLTAWVALTDVTEQAGPMRFIRGSHKWGCLNQGDFYGQDHAAQRDQITVPDGETWEEVTAILPPGGVSFHHNLTFHGSGPNRTTELRRSFAIHLRTEKSEPVNHQRSGLTEFIDQPTHCPIIYQG